MEKRKNCNNRKISFFYLTIVIVIIAGCKTSPGPDSLKEKGSDSLRITGFVNKSELLVKDRDSFYSQSAIRFGIDKKTRADTCIRIWIDGQSTNLFDGFVFELRKDKDMWAAVVVKYEYEYSPDTNVWKFNAIKFFKEPKSGWTIYINTMTSLGVFNLLPETDNIFLADCTDYGGEIFVEFSTKNEYQGRMMYCWETRKSHEYVRRILNVLKYSEKEMGYKVL